MEKRKGLSGGYGYLLLSIVFVTLFATGTTIASESIEGISDFTGVTPPSEIRACNVIAEDLYRDNLIFKIGDGYPFLPKEELDRYTSSLNFSNNDTLSLFDDENDGYDGVHILDKNFENVQSLENITYAYSNFGGGNITINVYSESTGVGEDYELKKQVFITNESTDIIETSESVDEKRLEKMRLEIKMKRNNLTEENPLIYYVGLRGTKLDEKVDYVWYKDIGTSIANLYSRTKQMAYCSVMQIANLFHAVTMTTGEWWMDMVLVPFQIVLLIIIIRVVSEIVSAFPFT